jgi:hypothetical protein
LYQQVAGKAMKVKLEPHAVPTIHTQASSAQINNHVQEKRPENQWQRGRALVQVSHMVAFLWNLDQIYNKFMVLLHCYVIVDWVMTPGLL